jgi:DNA mismatch endonuclease (patch repair protein)
VIDIVDPATRSRMMAGIKCKDTKPEVFLRKALHAQGLRYRLGGCGLPGKPDLVFPSRKAVVFVHGCFWHRHECRYFKWPQSNGAFWKTKLDRNVKRDMCVKAALKQLGWLVFTVWECELRETRFQLPNESIEQLLLELKSIK